MDNEYEVYGQICPRFRYRLIDECPPEFHDEEDVVEKCSGNFNYTDFYEIVFVSDPTGITYKNKYCAQCNGVIDGIRWALVIGSCLESIEKQHLTATEAKQFFLNHCELYNTRSEKVPRNIRTLSCKNYRDCGDDEKYQAEVNGCQVEPGFQDSPYIATLSPNTSALCYKCYFISEYRLCKKAMAGQKGHRSIQFLLNTQIEDVAADETFHARCGESFVFDEYTGNCKRLYCPPYHVVTYGDCIPLAMNDVTQYVPLTVVVKVDVNFTEYNNRELAMELAISLSNYFLSLKDAMDEIFVFPCKPVEYRLSATIEETLRDCLVITITYETNETCSIRQLRNDVLEIPVQFSLPSFYPEVEDRLNASSEWTLTFFELITVSDLGSVYLSRLPFSRNPPPNLSVFFLCPYFILSMTEYKDYVKVKDRAQYNDLEYVEMFEPTMKTLAGFYPISKTEIAVCLDTYFVADSGSLTRLGSIDVILFVFTCVRFHDG